MATGLLKRLGVETAFFDPLDLDSYAKLFEDKVRESAADHARAVCHVDASTTADLSFNPRSMIPAPLPARAKRCRTDASPMPITAQRTQGRPPE